MRNPEGPQTPYRRGSARASLNDLRWVYRKLLEIERRLSQLQGEQLRLIGRVVDDRPYLKAITDNTNQLIGLIFQAGERLEEAQQALRKKSTDPAEPSGSLRGAGRIGYKRRRGKPGKDVKG